MNRRAFLGSVGTVASAGLLSRALDGHTSLRVRVWQSEGAAAYEDVLDRASGYLRVALDTQVGDLTIDTVTEPVGLPSEGGRAVLADHWPRRVAEGVAGVSDVDPVAGVNLLVTDGDVTQQPAGYARPYVGASTGARHIADAPPAADASPVVPYSLGAVATQLLLHECGHALGLTHTHGSAWTDGDGAVASPMVGSYLWHDDDRHEYLDETNTCGESLPNPDHGGDRRLSLRFSTCASEALAGDRSAFAADNTRTDPVGEAFELP